MSTFELTKPQFSETKPSSGRLSKEILRITGMGRYTDVLRWDTVSYYAVIQFVNVLAGMGLKPSESGWRKVTRAYLRREESKFALGVFSLDYLSDLDDEPISLNDRHVHLLERLSEFIRKRPLFHWKLEWDKHSVQRALAKSVDVVEVEFDRSGRLKNLFPCFTERINHKNVTGLDEKHCHMIINAIKRVYNRTRGLQDKIRPIELKRQLDGWIRFQKWAENIELRTRTELFVERVLSAVYVVFEQDYGIRFEAPEFIRYKHPGLGFMTIVCRLQSNPHEADLWFQFQHTPVDGVPVQHALKELRTIWGVVDKKPLKIERSGNLMVERVSSKSGEPGVFHKSTLMDFRPFLKQRRHLLKYSSPRTKVSVAALLIWQMAQYEPFAGLKFTIPVDVPATLRRERTLGFVMIRPQNYFNLKTKAGGFFEFQGEFLRQASLLRQHKGLGYSYLENFALLPVNMYEFALRFFPKALEDIAGSVGVTIIKDAEYFISPTTDFHTNGFIAVSNFLNKSADGGRLCSVSIKGPKDKIRSYHHVMSSIAEGSGFTE